MEKEFKEILEKTSDTIEKLEFKIEEHADDLADDAMELWGDFKKNFSTVNEQLKTAAKDLEEKSDEAQLQAHLGTMEAQDRINNIKESVEEFTQKVSAKTQSDLDTVALRAHLAKMEAEDFWEKKGKKISEDFNESGDKVKGLTLEAASEIKAFFEKVSKEFNSRV